MTLVPLAVSWLAGIALARSLAIPWQVFLLLGLAATVGLIGWHGSHRFRLACACLLALALGGGRLLLALPRFDAHSPATYNDTGPVTLEGVVVAEPGERERYTHLRVRAERLVLPGGRELEVEGPVLVRVERYPAFAYGDRLLVTGLLESPPDEEDFSYREYLARQGIHSTMRDVQVTRVGSGEGNPLYAALLALKDHARATIAAILHEPEASLLTGILLGDESGIPQGVAEAFSTTGTSHIIAISGFNMTIIAGIFEGLARRLAGPRRAVWVAIGGVALYTILVGASAAVVRAAVMGVIYLLARPLGRTTFAPASLAAAAIAMTAGDPYLVWDVGFQLSFAATVGLVLYAAPLERGATRLLRRVLDDEGAKRAIGLLSEGLLVTLAAQITTLPLLLFYFRRLSLVTLLSNLLILSVQPAVMIAGGLATLAGMVWLPAGRALGWVAWLTLTYTIGMVRVTARVPWASVDLARVEGWMVWGFYLLLALCTAWAFQPAAWREAWTARARALWRALTARVSDRVVLSLSAILLLLSTAAWRSLPDGRLHVRFLDVGQGDAVFIRTPAGRQILVDGGPSSSTLLEQVGRSMPFWDHHLDLVILSHPDEDLLAGLIPVLERYRVDGVIVGQAPCHSPLCERWQEVLEDSGAHVWPGEAGLQMGLDEGLLLTVLHPAPGFAGTLNDRSLVLRLDYGEVCFLLTGDAGPGVEERLVAQRAWLECSVLKAAHHGDGAATTDIFLAAVDPQEVVIPVGEDDRMRRPHWDLLERLEGLGVHRTDEHGWVEVISDGHTYRVVRER